MYDFDYDVMDETTNSLIEENTYQAASARFFLQPALGIRGKSVESAFSTRLMGLKFSNISEFYK